MADVITTYEIYRFEKNWCRKERQYAKEAKNNLSYEEFCRLNEEYYMKIPEQLTAASCETEIIDNFFSEELHEAINQLPEKQRRRLILYYLNGLTFEEIAKAEGCYIRAVVKSIDTAIKNLKNILLKL
jgi:RNA polymerase sigma-70 factor (ECF subfamily)